MKFDISDEDFEKKWKKRVFMQCSCCFKNYNIDQYDKLSSFWINDDPKYGKECACPNCGKMFHRGKWQISSVKDIYSIHTTHLEMAQSPPNFFEDIMDSEYFWETMIKNNQNGKWLDFQTRYKSQEDAIQGHWMAYDKLEDMILNPDKYPQGIFSMIINASNASEEQRKTIQPDVKKRLK